jgi:hypothetical protein
MVITPPGNDTDVFTEPDNNIYVNIYLDDNMALPFPKLGKLPNKK